MILTIDCGNSNICFAVHENETITPLFFERIHTDRAFTVETLVQDLRMILKLHSLAPEKITGGILSSVVPDLTGRLKDAASEVIGREILVVDYRLNLAFENLMDKPETAGQDILSDMSGALRCAEAPLITIDMGTATVFSIVTPPGYEETRGKGKTKGRRGRPSGNGRPSGDGRPEFSGVMILPGVRTSLDSLTLGTSALPGVSLKAPEHATVRNAADSMKSGIVFGTAEMIDHLIDRIESETGLRFKVFATGGLSPFIVPYVRHEITLDPELLMKGLFSILKQNQ